MAEYEFLCKCGNHFAIDVSMMNRPQETLVEYTNDDGEPTGEEKLVHVYLVDGEDAVVLCPDCHSDEVVRSIGPSQILWKDGKPSDSA